MKASNYIHTHQRHFFERLKIELEQHKSKVLITVKITTSRVFTLASRIQGAPINPKAAQKRARAKRKGDSASVKGIIKNKNSERECFANIYGCFSTADHGGGG